MSRPVGLFCGPVIGTAIGFLAPTDLGLLGMFNLPGWFGVCTYVVAFAWVCSSWNDLQEDEEERRARRASESASISLRDFLSQSRVLVILYVMAFHVMGMLTVETTVPLVTKRVFGWTGAVCGLPLTAMAIALISGMVSLLLLTKRGCADRAFLLAASCLVPACFAGGAAIWELCRSLTPALVVVPFMTIPALIPYITIGSMMTLTRLVLEDAPKHLGKLSAVQNNMLAIASTLSPIWNSYFFSEEYLRVEGVPRTCWKALAVGGFLGFIGVFVKFKDLAPAVISENSSPFLKSSSRSGV